MRLDPLADQFDRKLLEKYSSNNLLPKSSTSSRYYSYDKSQLPDLTSTSVEGAALAVEKAHGSFEKGLWRKSTIHHRASIITNAIKALQRNSAKAAYLDTIETGRSFYSLFNHSLPKAVQTALWFCNSVSNITSNVYRSERGYNFAFDSIAPYGTVLCVLPWNDPLVLFCWKVIPALLIGNSVIVKPSEYSTGSALFFSELLHSAGVPLDVLQVVVGRETSAFNLLISDERVRAISMTGSSETAKYIQQTSSTVLRKLNFECGGKSAFVIPDELTGLELKRCAEVLTRNMFYNQGQICSSPSLLIVNSKVSAHILPLIKEFSTIYLPGNPLALNQVVGQICTDAVLSRTVNTLQAARDNQLEVWSHPTETGAYLEYGYVSHPPSFIICRNYSEYLANSFLHHEVFGPLLTIVESDSYDEMVEIANHSAFGLASSVWSSNINTLFSLSGRIEAGIVHLNTWGDDDIGIPFGGIKDSGEAREKCLESFNQFSYNKVIHVASSSTILL